MNVVKRERVIWPGMVLAGLALAVAVGLSWPEPTLRIVRLPDGESMPKTPRVATPAVQPVQPAVKVSRAVPAPRHAPAAVAPAPTLLRAESEPEPARVLAAVDPAVAGPAPRQSELELSGDYAQESPEQLGAAPLPGADPRGAVLTPVPPPVAG